MFGISRAGAVWCPIKPRNEAAENRELLDLFDCVALIYQRVFDPLVAAIRPDLRKLPTLVCLDGTGVDVVSFDDWVNDVAEEEVLAWEAESVDDIAMIVGTGGTTGQPKGVMPTADHYRPDGCIAAERLTSAGRPAPLVTVRIMDLDGNLLPPGERGEIVVRSSLVMAGYYRNPDATADASHHTGDIGYLDPDGFLYIVDRAKDMIITGGYNVYSAEVENAVMAHPSIRDCAVVGLPDEKWGERVTAVGEVQPGIVLDPAELTAFVRSSDRQCQGSQADRTLDRAAEVSGRQGAQERDQGAVAAVQHLVHGARRW
jgi:acyl-CoA synthetase (AMP-forming)/AMP-acid ligase II